MPTFKSNIAIVPIVLALLISFGLYMSVSKAHSHDSQELASIRQAFQTWKNQHQKYYTTPEEEAYRFSNFVESVRRVERKNSQNLSFKSGLNLFSDLSMEEFKSMYTGFKHDPNAVVEYDYSLLNGPTDENRSVDWRTQEGTVTPVKNQGQCGSCWAFSATGALEGLARIYRLVSLSFSEQQLVDCSKGFGNKGCNGGLMNRAFDYVRLHGINIEKNYPYTARDERCESKVGIFFIHGYANVPHKSNLALDFACDHQPVSVGVQADEWKDYESGIFDDKSCGTQLDHGVLLVGYTSEYWIVKNSWSEKWGEQGYIRLSKAAIPASQGGICGILLSASVPRVEV